MGESVNRFQIFMAPAIHRGSQSEASKCHEYNSFSFPCSLSLMDHSSSSTSCVKTLKGLEGALFPKCTTVSVSIMYSLLVFSHSRYYVPFVIRIIVQNVCSIGLVFNRCPSEAQRIACTHDALQMSVEEAQCVQDKLLRKSL